ncbi:MAG: carbohydrate kinase family protein [Patescibacteria group bacterium]
MFDIISIGSATRDVLMQSDAFEHAKAGSKVEIKKLVLVTGGGGTNYAVTFARQGLKTACIGVIGDDANGAEVLRELEGEGIDVSMFEKHHDDMTAYSVIMVRPDAERTILSYKGEGQHFNASELDFSKLQSKWLFLDSLGGHYDLFEKLVQHAMKNSMKIACNPGGKELEHGLEKLKPLFAHMDILLMNKEEAEGLAPDLRPYVKGILSISDGPRGVTVYDKDTTYTAGIPDSPVVERTGAGDAYGSGFVSEYIRSGSIEKAIQFGTANASSVVTKFGSKAGILKSGDWGPWPLVEVKKI